MVFKRFRSENEQECYSSAFLDIVYEYYGLEDLAV